MAGTEIERRIFQCTVCGEGTATRVRVTPPEGMQAAEESEWPTAPMQRLHLKGLWGQAMVPFPASAGSLADLTEEELVACCCQAFLAFYLKNPRSAGNMDASRAAEATLQLAGHRCQCDVAKCTAHAPGERCAATLEAVWFFHHSDARGSAPAAAAAYCMDCYRDRRAWDPTMR